MRRTGDTRTVAIVALPGDHVQIELFGGRAKLERGEQWIILIGCLITAVGT